MALGWLAERSSRPSPVPLQPYTDYSLTEVSFVLHDLSWRSTDGSLTQADDKLENEVMVDTWSSMDSTNSPLTDSGPSASEDCTPSTSSEPNRDFPSPSPAASNPQNDRKPQKPTITDKPRSRDLALDLEALEPIQIKPHFLDEDYQPPNNLNLEYKIPKPHFLDTTPSPDDIDERSDITNPHFLDDDIDNNPVQSKTGALPKRSHNITTSATIEEPRPNFRATIHYGVENAARACERDKRASQLYREAWPNDRDWTGHDSASIRSYSSNGSADISKSSKLENKMECVYSLLSLLTLSPDNNADLSGPLHEMSRSVESCIAMRQAGCIPLLVQLIHSKLPRETRDRAAKALRNIIHTQTDDKAGRREARVWRLLEQVREYCYSLEEVAEAKNDEKPIEDDATKHPSQSVAALMKLSFDEEHRHVVCQLGGLQALASLVSSDQAAHGSRTDDNTCLTMRKYAGMTLTNLTFGDGNNKSLLCSFKDFMMALVDQLESPNDDMRQVTAAVLRNLSWRADSNSKQVLREVGAVKGLTKAAMSCSKEATLKSVLSALWNLTAHCSMNKVALCSVDGALGFLVNMLNYDSPTKTLAIVENAGGIMRNVSSHIAVREDYRQILRERNCLGVLLQHLKSPSLTVVSNSCGTLWNLSARCPQDQQFLWDHGAVPLLRSLIHSKHKMIAMGSSAALKNLLNSKPGKCHIAALDSTARNMNLPVLPTLGVRKQKALEQELDQNLAETCDNIEPATSPSTSKREEKNLFNATEKQIAMNLDRHRMTSSSPMMGSLTSQVSLSHSAHLAGFLSCTNTLLKGASMVSRSSAGSSNQVNRSDSKDSVTSTHSDTVFEKVMRTGKVPIPTPRNRDLVKTAENSADRFKKATTKDGTFRYPAQPPIPPPRSSTELRTNYTESGYDLDQDSCDQPIDFSQKYSETKSNGALEEKPKVETKKTTKKDSATSFGDYQETDLDQPTDYSIRYAEHHSESASDSSEPPVPSVNEDTIQHFATEGTPYETPITFSTSTSMSDLRVIGKEGKLKISAQLKENPEMMTHSDEKDTCSIEEPTLNEKADEVKNVAQDKRGVFDTKFSSGLITPDEPVNYCDEGTPGYFSRVSSLSSLGEATEEESLAKRNAIATIHVDPSEDFQVNSSVKDKESSKAVTFASEPVAFSSSAATPGTSSPPNASSRNSPPDASSRLAEGEGDLVDETPLMFSRTSSLGSLPDCGQPDDQGSLHSSISRMTSGCISPSEIPDSPPGGNSPRLQLCRPPQPREQEVEQEPIGERSVFDERARTFVVENTPAHFSTATSLSSLTIDDDHDRKCNQNNVEQPIADEPARVCSVFDERVRTFVVENTPAHFSTATSLSSLNIDDEHERKCGPSNNEQTKGPEEPHSVFDERARTFVVENTPAHFSTATSLSSLNIDDDDRKATSERAADTSQANFMNNSYGAHSDTYQRNQHQSAQDENSKVAANISACVDTDSSNLSDNSDLLNECIQKGIDTVLNKGPSSESGSISYGHRHGPYNSLPPYLRSSTETVKMSHDYVNVRSIIGSSPPPPLPPRHAHVTAPPPPPRHRETTVTERKHESRLPIKTPSRDHRNKPSLPITNQLSKTDSLSSLDSFGSTDREIFEQTVNAGVNRARLQQDKVKAHSVERPQEVTKQHRFHKSLDRSDRIKDKLLASSKHSQMRKLEAEFSGLSMTRSPYSYHGETSSSTLAHHARSRHSRYHDEGPPSLPIRIERSSSLSSLSNESFGSTDREVFERCVKMGMSKPQGQCKKGDLNIKARVRSDDRLEFREHRRRSRKDRPAPNALDRMVGDEYAKDRAILEEVIARGAGDNKAQSKNASCRAGGSATAARDNSPGTNFDDDSAIHTSDDTCYHDTSDPDPLNKSNEMPTVDSGNTTFESVENDMDHSNEFLAPASVNTTLESEGKDELNRSNESYAEVLDHSWSDSSPPKDCDVATLTRKKKVWTDIKTTEKPTEVEIGPKNLDTWNDNTCPDDVTFPTLSGSIHLVSSIKSEVLDYPHMLPDLLEKSGVSMFTRPDLTNKLDRTSPESNAAGNNSFECRGIDDIPEPSFTSIVDDPEHKYDSLMSTEIAKEAARLAAQLKNSQYTMETSISSLDLDNINPPSNLGSLLSLTNSANFDETSSSSRKQQKPRKKSMPISIMAKRALSNSMHQGSPDSQPHSFIENVKPPSEMEHLDMEGSMLSVCSIVSETADGKDKPSIVFDFKQPVTEFPMRSNLTVFDLDKVNPPSLFDEMTESTFEMEQTTANLYEDCTSTLNVVTDIPSGSENCTPIPSDYSSVETTPKRQRALKYLTPKEKRLVAKDRYQTYTITDTATENDVTVAPDSENYLTWTKSESDRSDDYVTANSEIKSKRRMSAKQRRIEDRARYQTQTVDLSSVINQNLPEVQTTDPNIESLKQRLAAKRTIKQRRMEDAERFRTRTLSEDIPPSPTFVSKDANFENVETTTGYDSLSSNELNHQQITDDRSDDVFSRDADSGHNEDDIELNSTQLKTFTKSFQNYLPVTESPSAVDMCVFNNLKNIEITSSYTKTVQSDVKNPNSGDFASYAGDLDDKTHSDSDTELPPSRPKPKIVKPTPKRDESLDSNDSREQDGPKAIRGRKKAAYVSPYRNSYPVTKKLTPTAPKPGNKTGSISKAPASIKPRNPPKSVNKTPVTPKSSSVNTSPKKTLKSPYQFTQKSTVTTPLSALRVPLVRQGTFTKEDSSVPAKSLPVTEQAQTANCNPTLANPNTSPSRLPLSKYSRPMLRKANSNDKPSTSKTAYRSSAPTMRSSASNHSLQSNESSKTVTLASKNSRPGSTSSVNSAASKAKDVESRIAGLWRKVEQAKKQPAYTKPDKRVWIEPSKQETPRLIRSSTFDGQPQQTVSTPPKQKTEIGIRVSQIPSLKPKTQVQKTVTTNVATSSRKVVQTRVFVRKSVNGQGLT